MSLAETNTDSFITARLSPADWQAQKETHEREIAKLLDRYLKKRERQHKDLVMDFLFEYYAFRPSHLRRWSPGFGVLLQKADQTNAPELSEFSITSEGAYLDPALFPDNRKGSIHWMLKVLKNSASRKPSFGCFGMHEWAMVYRKGKIRHNQIALRMDKEELASFVESRPLVCTHFDAFRFFSKPAQPMNKFSLSRETFAEMEQPGCIHTNMDLYKWAFKLYPWISSNTIREAFELAVEARVIDMKASPYDLIDYGLAPIKIETEEGRLKYLECQKGIYEKSMPLRQRLIDEYQYLADCFDC